MTHQRFRTAPIVEALAAFRFVGQRSWSEQQDENVRRRLREIYPHVEEQVHHRFEIQLAPEPSATTQKAANRLLHYTDDRRALVAFERELLSVHVLAPYPGWDAFDDRTRAITKIVAEETGAIGLTEVALRYMNRIALPADSSESLDTYFTAIPRRPAQMPGHLGMFQFVTQSYDHESGTNAVFGVSSAPPSPGEGFVMLHDLNLTRVFPEHDPLPIDQCASVLSALHEQQYAVFMDSLTDQARNSFDVESSP